MSAATDMLESGRRSLVAHYGENLTWVPGSAVVKSEWSEVVTNEQAKAIVGNLTDDDGNPLTIDFRGVFDEAYQVIESGEIASTGPAVMDVKRSDLPDAKRGDLILRGTEQYFVQKVMPDGLVSIVLTLSKHAH